jgi:cytochrome d ubiquinol oxidase subunit II
MGMIWFWLVAYMLAAYVVLDGFDIGAGILHLFVARESEQRERVLRSIGPVWDGNEVWLIAAGGTLYFAFPLLYASSFSGFYLPLTIVLWLLIVRGISIELRGQFAMRVWRDFYDGAFALSSVLLAIFFGAALANVIRGVPIGPDGYFFAPLWTNWRVGPHPGILDWYTVIGGLLAVAALGLHGGLYLAMKNEGSLQTRARTLSGHLWPAVLLLTIIGLPATVIARRASLANYLHHPIAFAIPLAVGASLLGSLVFSRRKQDTAAFLCSCAYLATMLVGAAFGLYPTVLPSSSNHAYDITVGKALAGHHSLSVGLIWWSFGLLLATGYFVMVYRMFRGKVKEGESYH